MDLAILAASLILLTPLVAVIALAVWLDSPGPVLYRQTRVGRGGRPFRMLKFRTMSVDADDRRDELRHLNGAIGGLFKLENDPRLTRVGRILRKYSLDELPQLVNVVRGEMSLVGARPFIPEEDRLIGHRRSERLALRPGMTGEWQLQGPVRVGLNEMIEIDCRYVRTWSALRDLKLLCRTALHVCAGRGI
jgi:lipopolysaccharide/colanic/teichoic acid biosynthesis glycosyltransferase